MEEELCLNQLRFVPSSFVPLSKEADPYSWFVVESKVLPEEQRQFIEELGAFDFGTAPEFCIEDSLEVKEILLQVEGALYRGQTKNNMCHGKGAKIFGSGKAYIGWWNNGVEWGQGRFISSELDVYEGEWKMGRICGHGT
mmetsp:Transcript_9733/g.7337  ORF Transcript_9733/g.7337 Transcript_9733/m.7337 type:complete len:140 (+) Transcript_9733:271-690(+)|eukprot:CAMPEP_0202959414 /NCGR_PEP_ID=MMETSP1396-20130829/3598_1 /ASSEMBLY_ACC=CAM_ASM_000872 /TAXON_ID= /ORGANISM="Pseudokeronopsis sp., Strain Brazil" /LENGTH=139 /DNA_ID=CAMNT_0049677955 /DNA_START=267 /DNA_END=686 /DNA_ORIENTATION=-